MSNHTNQLYQVVYKNMYTMSLKYFTNNEIFCLEIIQVQNLTCTGIQHYIKKTNLVELTKQWFYTIYNEYTNNKLRILKQTMHYII